MKQHLQSVITHHRGSSLVEVVVSIGVLAVAVPLIFGSIVESGNAGQYSAAETRAPWMVGTCMEEIRASRAGKARYFDNTGMDQPFPPTGEIWALGFAESGSIIGKLSRQEYESGLRKFEDSDIRYIASIRSSTKPPDIPEGSPLSIHISVEFPAAAPAAKRRTLDFHTLLP
jgi:type II secretory pathway pseudopilin PulG